MPRMGKRRIAPRLMSGKSRDQMTGGLPPPVRAWIRMMAEREGKSQSFWMEEQFLKHVYPAHLGARVHYVKPARNGKG